MTIYDDIKKSIYNSLFYYNQKDREIRLLKSFIYADLKLIVSIIEDKPIKKTVKQQATEYYYGLYNILTNSAIQQYSNEYQAIVDKLPKATELLIDRTKQVQDLEKQEKKMIEQFVIDFKVNPLYWQTLQDMMPYLLDQDTLQIYTFFLGNKSVTNTNQFKNTSNSNNQEVQSNTAINVNLSKNEEVKINVEKTVEDKKGYEQTTITESIGIIKITDENLDHTLSDTFYFSDKNADIQDILFKPLKPNEILPINLGSKELIHTVFQYKSSESLLDKFNRITNKKQTPALEKPTKEEIESWPTNESQNVVVQTDDGRVDGLDDDINKPTNENTQEQINVPITQPINNNKEEKIKKKEEKKNNYKEINSVEENNEEDEEDEEDDESQHKVAIAVATVVAIVLGLITSTILVGPWF